MTTFIIIYLINDLIQVIEGIGIVLLCKKLGVDWDEVYANVIEHAPFGAYYPLKQWYITILDFLIASPLLGHFMAAVMVVEAFQLYNKEAAE